MEKDADRRFQSALDLRNELEEMQKEARKEKAQSGPSVAILPFQDLSPDRDQDYFCEGIAEELINALNHIDGLCVAARSSSFQFRGPAADIRAVGRRLDVATLVEGSVRKLGDRLRVNVQLINVSDGYQRWSQRFERAIELDPAYAPAWAGAADANAWLFEWWGGDDENLRASDRASLKALTLGPQLANVHASRGFALVLQDRYDEAASEFEAALKINSKHYHALYYYARAAFAHGEIERSAELFRRAGDAVGTAGNGTVPGGSGRAHQRGMPLGEARQEGRGARDPRIRTEPRLG